MPKQGLYDDKLTDPILTQTWTRKRITGYNNNMPFGWENNTENLG